MASIQERRAASRHHRQFSVRPTTPSRNKKRRSKGLSFAEIHTCVTVGLFCISVVLFITVVAIFYKYERHGDSSIPSAITPLAAPKISDLAQFKGKHREDLLWGTYRPHLYLGIRARTPESLLAGLMWISVDEDMSKIRHICEASDNLDQYGWLRHDGRSYGRQEIVDGNVVITTTFLKQKFTTSGYGGDWVANLSLKRVRTDSVPQKVVSVLFYVANEAGDKLELQSHPESLERQSKLVSGLQKGVGRWQLHAVTETKADIHYAGYNTRHMQNLSELVQYSVQQKVTKGSLHLPDFVQSSSNVAVFQFDCTLPFEVDLVFISGVESDIDVQTRIKHLSGSSLHERIKEKEEEFEARFQQTFNLDEKKDISHSSAEVGKAALSNLLGGIGYFFGQSQIAIPSGLEVKVHQKYWLYWPAALSTAVPSRSMFPRGFLWDEGFHQLLVWKWDKKLSMDILAHWLDLINVDGWIPREQILGSEARSKVPEEFVLQYTSNANPPTLFLVFQDIIQDIENSGFELSVDETEFLKSSFPRLEAWFKWFNTSQVGKLDGSYFWHGRDTNNERELNPKTLSSGLDDYPRASHPSFDERHLDLRCWIGLAAKAMAKISALVGSDSLEYEGTSNRLHDMTLLNKLHFDPNIGYFADYGNHTEKVKLSWKVWQDTSTGYVHRDLVRVTYGHPRLRLVPHFGYVSLFPFITRIIPEDSPILQKHLDLIQDEKLLWTGYGLRSLATTSTLFMKYNTQHDPPYWRGSIWINFNFLVLSSLRHYAQEPGPYRSDALELYTRLRTNVIRNVVHSYSESGYLWEQYDNSKEGQGKGAHPFTGWTSLILLIMAEKY